MCKRNFETVAIVRKKLACPPDIHEEHAGARDSQRKRKLEAIAGRHKTTDIDRVVN
jgi:hypothetical protein